MLPTMPDALTAGLAPLRPSPRWFDDPQLDGATPLTVDKTGRVRGHLAAWGSCHIGFPGVCVEPPRSESGYELFHLGEVECSDGSRVACGQITLGTGHPSTARGVSAQAAARHYDDTGTAVADVCCGEDEHGIWVAGAVRPHADEELVRELMGAKLSGDWRPVNGRRELVAALAVNTPGFPIPRRRALVAALDTPEPEPLALVAAGIVVEAAPSQSRLAALHARARGGLDALAEFARGA